jgi:hypothetical protein
MRTMMKFEMDMNAANEAIKDGRLPKILEWIANEIKPEATFFYAEHGRRTAEFIFEMRDSAQIPQLAEPLFLLLNAQIEFKPVMNLACKV